MLSEVLCLTNLKSKVLLQKSTVDKIWNDMSLKRGNVYLGVITTSFWHSVALQLLGTNKKKFGIKFCSPQTVRIHFGIFFMGSGFLTLEDFFKTYLGLFSQLIWQYEISLFASPAWQAEGNGWGNVLEFFFFPIQSTLLCLIGLKKYVCLWKWRCKLGAINFDYLDYL